MGVNMNNIVMAGVRLDQSLHDYDKHEDISFSTYDSEKGDFVLCSDPMSEEQLFAGIILAMSPNGRCDEPTFDEVTECFITDQMRSEIILKIVDRLETSVNPEDVKIYAFCEYT